MPGALPAGLVHPRAGRQHRGAAADRGQLRGSNILGFLNLFTGGGLSRLALFALGIMPYITASIILQLLTVVSPSLEKLSKEGEVGQAKITQYTRYLTVGLAAAQAVGYVFLFRSQGNRAGAPGDRQLHAGSVILIVVCLTAGCVLLMWFGELITQRASATASR
jgi:preprotein translocase subunit SecY